MSRSNTYPQQESPARQAARQRTQQRMAGESRDRQVAEAAFNRDREIAREAGIMESALPPRARAGMDLRAENQRLSYQTGGRGSAHPGAGGRSALDPLPNGSAAATRGPSQPAQRPSGERPSLADPIVLRDEEDGATRGLREAALEQAARRTSWMGRQGVANPPPRTDQRPAPAAPRPAGYDPRLHSGLRAEDRPLDLQSPEIQRMLDEVPSTANDMRIHRETQEARRTGRPVQTPYGLIGGRKEDYPKIDGPTGEGTRGRPLKPGEQTAKDAGLGGANPKYDLINERLQKNNQSPIAEDPKRTGGLKQSFHEGWKKWEDVVSDAMDWADRTWNGEPPKENQETLDRAEAVGAAVGSVAGGVGGGLGRTVKAEKAKARRSGDGGWLDIR